MTRANQDYVIYFSGGSKIRPELNIKPGRYSLTWMDPQTGRRTSTIQIEHPNGYLTVESPDFIGERKSSVDQRPAVDESPVQDLVLRLQVIK